MLHFSIPLGGLPKLREENHCQAHSIIESKPTCRLYKIFNQDRIWTPLILSLIHSENSLRTVSDSSSAATNPIAKNSPSSFSFQLTTSSSDLVRIRETTIASGRKEFKL
ncbi:hypothetical protein P8452_77751 [Trifolium repens]|nr:hypothetical protein P8452_77751 [Trifolium repens]